MQHFTGHQKPFPGCERLFSSFNFSTHQTYEKKKDEETSNIIQNKMILLVIDKDFGHQFDHRDDVVFASRLRYTNTTS